MNRFKIDRSVEASMDVENNVMRCSVEHRITNVTLFHELMHIVQFQSGESQTEEYNSIAAMARMPADMVDFEKIPYIDTPKGFPRTEFPGVCELALLLRTRGNKHYIQWLKNEMIQRVKYGEP